MTTVEIPKTTVKNNTFSQIVRALKSDHSTSHALWNSPALKSFQHVQAELLVSPHGLIIRNTKLVIPTRLQGRVVKLAHKGYLGIIKTKQLLCMCMSFSQMDKLFEGHVRNCIPCQAMSPKSSRDPTQPTPLHYGPWKNLAIDFGRPFPNWKYLLILMDKYSCFPVVEAVSTTNGLSVMPALQSLHSLIQESWRVITDHLSTPTSSRGLQRSLFSLIIAWRLSGLKLMVRQNVLYKW